MMVPRASHMTLMVVRNRSLCIIRRGGEETIKLIDQCGLQHDPLICTHSSQSMAMMIVTSSAGRPTVSSTITIVTRPACGMPAAPMEAAVAVTL